MKLFSLLQKTVTTLSLVVVFCSVATISVAQQNKTIKVKGVVTDNTGAALAGVNVVVENTTIATSTSGKGEYTISVPNTGGGNLWFSAS